MIVKHCAINTENQEIIEGKEYLYSEYNYPLSSTLTYYAVVTVKNIVNDEIGVGFDVIPVKLIKYSSEELRNFHAFQKHAMSDIWKLSDLDRSIDIDDFDLCYFVPTEISDVEQKHLFEYLQPSLVESKEHTPSLLPIFKKYKKLLNKFEIQNIKFTKVTNNAMLQIIFLLDEAIKRKDNKLIKKYSIWLKFAFVKSIIKENEYLAQWLEKYSYHYIEKIEKFVKQMQSK